MTDTIELIARLELLKRSLPNVFGVSTEAQAEAINKTQADVIAEAQIVLAAQAQEIERLTRDAATERTRDAIEAKTIERCARTADAEGSAEGLGIGAAIRALRHINPEQ